MEESKANHKAALIKANDSFHQQVLSSIYEAIAVMDHDFNVTYWNAMAENMYGWSAREAAGKNLIELLNAEIPGEGVENVLIRSLEETHCGGDMIFYHKDGRQVPTHLHAQVISDEQGEFLGIVATFRDMSEKVKYQRELAFQAQLLDNIHDAVVAVDEKDIIVYCNKAFEDLFGLWREELLGQRNAGIVQRFIITDAQQQILQRFNEQAFRILEDNNFTDIGCVTRSGDTVYLDINTVMLTGPCGEYKGFIASARDITARKLAEDERRKSEQWLTMAISVGRLGTYDRNVKTGEAACNDEFFRIVGYQPGEIRPTPEAFWARVHPDDRDAALVEMGNNIRQGGYFTHEMRLLWRDGTVHWIDNRGYAEHDREGQPERFYGVIIDITRFKLAELALQQSERKYRELVKYAPTGIYEVDFHTNRFLSVNDVACQLTGYSREELLQMNTMELLEEESRTIYKARIKRWLNGEKPEETVDYKLKTRDGREIYAELKVTFTRDLDGKPVGATGIVHDVTVRTLAEKALRDREQHLEEMVGERTWELEKANAKTSGILVSIQDPFYTLDREWRFTYINQAAMDQLDFQTDWIGENIWERFPEVMGTLFWDKCQEVIQTGQPQSFEIQTIYLKPDWLQVSLYPLSDGLSVFCRDIRESKRAEQELRRSEERFFSVFHYSPIMMAIMTRDARYIDVNQAWEELVGINREQAIGRHALEMDMWVDEKRILDWNEKLLEQKYLTDFELQFRAADGEVHTALASARLINIGGEEYFLHTAVDITSQKHLEREMARLDRLSLVGEMAASIGHEIRNPMTTVRGFLQMLEGKEEYHYDKEYFEIMIEEVDRANAIITEYLNMAKNKQVELKPQILNAIIKSLLPIIQSDANRLEMKIKLDLNCTRELLLDENEIRQLIVNMARNGMEAMKQRGTLTIGTREEGEDIILYIKDEGSGIDPYILENLGTPFITTKDMGTGLGLAVCYSIAARHNARIDCDTGSAGTTFYIKFSVKGTELTTFCTSKCKQ